MERDERWVEAVGFTDQVLASSTRATQRSGTGDRPCGYLLRQSGWEGSEDGELGLRLRRVE